MRDVREGWFSRLADDDWEANADKWPKPAIAVRCEVVTGCPSGYVRELLDAADGASVEDVKAGLAAFLLIEGGYTISVEAAETAGGDDPTVTWWIAYAEHLSGIVAGEGTSRAAAVLALAAKVEEGRDA